MSKNRTSKTVGFTTRAELYNLIDQYFRETSMPTLTGFALHIGLASIDDLGRFARHPDFRQAMQFARDELIAHYRTLRWPDGSLRESAQFAITNIERCFSPRPSIAQTP